MNETGMMPDPRAMRDVERLAMYHSMDALDDDSKAARLFGERLVPFEYHRTVYVATPLFIEENERDEPEVPPN